MNFKGISFYLSLFCFPVSCLSLINIFYASYFDYFLSINSYFTTLAISLLFGLIFFYYGRKSPKNINFIEQLILIIFAYILTSVLISIPFYLSNYQVTFLNSFVRVHFRVDRNRIFYLQLLNIDPLILWRSSSQWLGGLFFLSFLLIIFK